MNNEPGAHHDAARASGCRCDICPLRNAGAGPVPPTLQGRDLLVVGESPSPYEVDTGATAIGPTGREIRAALAAGGFPEAQASYTNAMLCRPPGGDLEGYLRECKKNGQPSPLECCKPHLESELSQVNYALYVGGAAVKAAGAGDSVLKLRGTPLAGPPAGLATLHPAFVLRDAGRLMRGVFRFDVAKAVRLSRGGTTWTDPAFVVVRDAADLAAQLAKLEGPIAIDTETDGVNPWTCRLRRIGFSDGRHHVIYSPLSVHGHQLLEQAEIDACTATVNRFVAQPREWYFHNFYAYDSIVLSQHGMVVNETNLFDSLIGHHIGPTSELPHKLDFLGSIYTDAPAWKGMTKHEKKDS